MSTTIKRVALVAVAALSLGVVSVAPSQATVQANSLTLSSATSTQQTSETSTASAAVATLSFLNTNVGDTVSVTAYLMSAPAGNVATPVLQVAETSSATVGNTAGATTAVGYENTTQVAYVSGTTGPVAVSAKWKVYMNSPAKAGTYVVKLVPAVVAGGGVIDTTGVTLTITVTQNPATDIVATSATSILNSGETVSATSDATVTADKTASTSAAAATIVTTFKNAAGSATTGESYTATVSGPGVLGSGTSANVASITPLGRALTVQNGDIVELFPDGSSGVSTVTISSKAGLVLATKTVTFYGDATKITASTTALTTGTIAKVGDTANLISFKVTDAAGTAVTTGSYYLVSSNTAIISNSYTPCSYGTTYGWTCTVTGVAKGTANVYVTNRASSTATTPTTEVKSDVVSVRVGSTTPASVVVATDKTSYAPGEKITLTVTVKDSDGNAIPTTTGVAAIFATGGISSSYALTGDTTSAVSFDVVDGVKSYTLYAPQVVSGNIKLSWTTGTGLATANNGKDGSVSFAVVNTIADAATDAANEATDAANAATDAALAAADAADAATAAAQDASDAVAALATQVESLKAQIKTLTALVIKIQKKLKA